MAAADYGAAQGAALADAGAAEEEPLRRNFMRMSLSFAVSHAACTTPLIVASSLMGTTLAAWGNGALFVAALVGSLWVAVPATSLLGLRGALIFGTGLYCVYIGGFGVALLAGQGEQLSAAAWLLASVSGGLAGSVIWTAQGGYFGETATRLAAATGQPREAATAALASSFTFWFLVLEVVAKVCFTLLQEAGVAAVWVALLYAGVGIAATLVMASVRDFKTPAPSTSLGEAFMDTFNGAASLWGDPVIWLLSLTNLTFGFSAAFMNGYVNGEFLSVELGPELVAAVGAAVPLTAALFAQAYGAVSAKTGKGPIITLGAVSFLCIPLCLLVLGCCSGWGFGMLVLYFLQGSGRAVFESTNRAAFADLFAKESTEAAFANCALQTNIGFAVSFFLQTTLGYKGMAWIIIVLAVATPASFWLASRVASKRASSA